MLDKDLLVAHVPTKSLNRDDIVSYFNKVMGCETRSLSDVVLVLAALCIYISSEEIFFLFPTTNVSSLDTVFRVLQKKGCLRSMPLGKTDGTAKKYYMITPDGYETAEMILQKPLPKLNRGKTSRALPYLCHAYSTGYNLMSMLSLSLSVDWRREVSDSFADAALGRNYKKIGSIWTDAVCTVHPDDGSQYRLVYFEQDMLTERPHILMDKLKEYYRLRLMAYASDIVVFSFRKGGVSAEPNSRYMKDVSFSTGNCQELYELLERTWEPDAFQFLDYSDISDDFKQYIISFLKRIGGIEIVDTEDGVEYHRTDVISRPEFVKEYLDSLKSRTNPYMFREMNRIHSHYKELRLSYAVDAIFEDISNPPDFTWPLLQGFQVLYLPTSLVVNYMPYAMLSLFPKHRDKLMKVIAKYFGDTDFAGELSERMYVLENKPLRMRNIFTYRTGSGHIGTVSVEFPCMDLGTWLRVYMLANHYNGTEPFNVVCVFDTMEQAREFLNTVHFNAPADVDPDKSGIYCMLFSELEKPHPLFSDADPVSHSEVRYLSSSS